MRRQNIIGMASASVGRSNTALKTDAADFDRVGRRHDCERQGRDDQRNEFEQTIGQYGIHGWKHISSRRVTLKYRSRVVPCLNIRYRFGNGTVTERAFCAARIALGSAPTRVSADREHLGRLQPT